MNAARQASGEREAELERVLREVLKVLDSMAHCGPVEFEGVAAAEQPNGEECFGPFAEVHDGAVVVWPDLRWAKDQIVKALGS
jgi:hypothetical protein